MLAAGEKMYAYQFEGYWKDVGTIQSLWQANMDLLGENPEFSFHDEKWRIFTRHETLPPQFIGDGAKIKNSIITEGCEIYGTVENSVLFSGVKVMPGAVVRDSVVMDSTQVGSDSRVSYSIIDSNVKIGDGASVGGEKGTDGGLAVIGEGQSIGDGEKIEAGVMIPDLR